MNRIPLCLPLLALSFLFTAPPPTSADPSGLLDQAIKENKNKAPADDVKKLVNRADRLADQKKFNEAIKLYEKAYRLAPSDQANYARLLVAKRAAGVMTARDREALELIEQQQASAVKQIFRTVRLNMIQTRQAMRSGNIDLAKAKIESAGAALDSLPDYVDDAPYRQRIATLSRDLRLKAGKSAGKTETGNDSTITITRRADDDDPDAPFTLMDTGEDDGAADVENAKTGEIIDVDEVLQASRDRHTYDRELARALTRQRSDAILSTNEAALPLTGMTFPENWAERIGRRTRNRDGVIYEGKPFTGKDGQTYQTVIYDLGDLVHPVPNFYASYPGTVRRQRMEHLDRVALRNRSEIFNGYADDLAAGLPLLHFFGGIDNNAVSTRTDPRESRRIIATLERFINSQ